MRLNLLQRTVKTLIDLHGSVRKAGKAVGIEYTYLHKLLSGKAPEPKDDKLAKLGLRKRESCACEKYERIKK